MDNVVVCRQELESVTLKLQLQVCRYCEKATDSQAVVAAVPAPVMHGPRDQLPQSCAQPQLSLAESNRQQSQQQQLEIPARLCFVILLTHVL